MSDRQAQIAVVGGGIVGASILNALARLGVGDLILIERTELIAGSTWHAAGLVPIYTAHRAMAMIEKKPSRFMKVSSGGPVEALVIPESPYDPENLRSRK